MRAGGAGQGGPEAACDGVEGEEGEGVGRVGGREGGNGMGANVGL